MGANRTIYLWYNLKTKVKEKWYKFSFWDFIKIIWAPPSGHVWVINQVEQEVDFVLTAMNIKSATQLTEKCITVK